MNKEIISLLIVNTDLNENRGWCKDNWSTYENECMLLSVSSQLITATPNSATESGNDKTEV